MIDVLPLLGYILAGLAVGIFGGLLPAVPVYIGPFVLYTFHHGMSLTEMLVFWLTAFIGGQYFGSVATITTNIPGEESSLIYIDDLKGFSLQEKNKLLYDTALSSTVATVMSIIAMWFCISFLKLNQLPFLYGIGVQGTIYLLLLASFMFIGGKRWYITIFTILFGLSIAPHANYALPNSWYNWTWLFEGYTFYSVILGILIIPNIIEYTIDIDIKNSHFEATRHTNFKWWNTIRSSILGFFVGLIPGPSAEAGSIAAYNTSGKDSKDRIVAAEAANNSAIIASVISLFMLNIPINNNSVLMSGIFDMHGLIITDALLQPSEFFGVSVINVITTVLLCVTGIYYLLSTNLIDWYVRLMVLLHGRVKSLLLAIVSILIYVDLLSAEITMLHYFILLIFFTVVGIVLKRLKVSTIPLMFSILLGDRLVWVLVQSIKLYF